MAHLCFYAAIIGDRKGRTDGVIGQTVPEDKLAAALLIGMKIGICRVIERRQLGDGVKILLVKRKSRIDWIFCFSPGRSTDCRAGSTIISDIEWPVGVSGTGQRSSEPSGRPPATNWAPWLS